MSDEPFVDCHVHFWDHSVPDLDWEWLRSGFTFRRWEATGELNAPRYLPADLRAEAEGTGLTAVVHVNGAHPVEDPARETEWLDQVATTEGMPEGVIGSGRLRDPDSAASMRRQARYPRFRGVRDGFAVEDLELDLVPDVMDTAAELGLSVELRRDHDRIDDVDELAARWPSVTVALSHACLPLERTDATRAAWAAAMTRLAARPNVVCKISTVAGASDPDWTVASIRPWILGAIEAFGPDRCVLGSNWPVDRVFASYRGLVDAYREVVGELDPDEQAAVLHRTASRVYRL